MRRLRSRPRRGLWQLYNREVTRPSTGGEIFGIVFGGIFVVAGIFAAGTFLFAAPSQSQGNAWVGVLIAAVFFLIGCGIVYAAIYGTNKLREQAAAAEANPQSPWLWRKDWAASRAESTHRNSATGLWLFAIFWNAIAVTVAGSILPKLWRISGLTIFFPLTFCAVGVILAGAAVRASIRRKRFGQTYFEFASLPFSPGRALKGTIHLRFNTDAKHGIDLRLSCIRRVVCGSGKDRSTQENVLWQADKNVPRELLTPGPMGDAIIPVDFGVPSDAYESNHEQPSDQVLWLLHAHADVPGVDLFDDFEVPVFNRTPSPASASDTTAVFLGHAQAAAIPPAFQSDASDVNAPDNPGVVVSAGMNGGTEFYFSVFRNPARTLCLIVFTAGWTAMVYFLGHSKAPWFFAPVFGLFDLVLFYAVIQATMGSFRIEVGNGKLITRRAVLGIGSAREIPFSNIAQILAMTPSVGQGRQPFYSLRLLTKDGKNLTLADSIDNRQEARWVVVQLEKFVGLKLDTHVAIDAGVGYYGPPPQRGPVPLGSPVSFRRTSPAGIAMGIAFFLAWMGFIGYRFVFATHRQPARISKSAVRTSPVPGKPSVRQVDYSPLTDPDVAHLQSLPQQAEAEELLDRAIQHDARALELFEQNIGGWHNLKATARMSQLESRSSFSTDLRVRYANADLNLALNGLAKTESSADQLIAIAQADPAHRAYSVYYMGVLAGRGVAYDRLYAILLNYAKNDADPQVRQWAVEGMRFLGTDEALEQLFDSFTHDASDAVRDRAGCNVSDCGTFMRKQRMRMVPKLIDLAADPQTTSQMRNWAFLALREITDEALPANTAAWQDWYTRHGAEKMAEFEQMDWWKVLGDQ
jgi:HEAT repeat protein